MRGLKPKPIALTNASNSDRGRREFCYWHNVTRDRHELCEPLFGSQFRQRAATATEPAVFQGKIRRPIPLPPCRARRSPVSTMINGTISRSHECPA